MYKFTENELAELKKQYEDYKSRGLSLDMSRGKPCTEQLDLSEPLLADIVTNKDCYGEGGVDLRNYGVLDGITEMKRIFADLMGVTPDMVIAGDSSSLKLMYDALSDAMYAGVLGSDKPWSKYDGISFICVVPGYDRHFAVTERLGVNMINVPLLDDGPDMDMIEKLVASNETIKGYLVRPEVFKPRRHNLQRRGRKTLCRIEARRKGFQNILG